MASACIVNLHKQERAFFKHFEPSHKGTYLFFFAERRNHKQYRIRKKSTQKVSVTTAKVRAPIIPYRKLACRSPALSYVHGYTHTVAA